MIRGSELSKLFGSNSRVAILELFFGDETKSFRVNEVVKKTEVNARLVSVELKKLAKIGILMSKHLNNTLLYKIDSSSILTDPLRSIFAKHDWLEWERPSRIHHLVLTLEAGLKPMKEYYGHCLPLAHLVFNYDNVTWFFKISEFRDLGEKLIPIYLKNKAKIWHDFEKYAAMISDQKNYKDFYKNYINFWKVAYLTEPISFYVDSLLKAHELISIQDQSFTDEYENLLWDLAKKAKIIGLSKIDVGPVIEKYHWIRNSYYGIHRLTEEEVKTEIRKKMGKKKTKSAKIANPNSISKKLLAVGQEMVLMQDKRKKYMMQAAYYLHEFLKKEGKKYKLSPIMMSQSLASEVLKLPKGMAELKESLKIRQGSCTITADITNGIKVYNGQIFFPDGVSRKAKFEIRGNVVCGGKAVGRARIITQMDSLYKVNHGDVIVAPMTSPDFMPAIRRCVAIVTNFGGITCHAAIIAREFNIPCIVGTNNATERIGEGDLVEVDADNGVVRVLQESSK